jgi:hypothetical protein
MKWILGRSAAGAAALTLSLCCVGPVLASAAPSDRAAGVTLGATSSVPISCAAGVTTVQLQDTGAPTYTVPAAGVITSFSYYANNAGQVRMVLMGPSATAGHRTLLAASPTEAVTLGSQQTFPIRIAAPAGAVLGLWNSQNDMGCWGVAPTDNKVEQVLFNPATETDYAGTHVETNAILALSAVWEPDADHDGYGDVSQDACPQSAQTQAACPAPDTTVTKQPKKKSTKRKVTIVFSSVAGATFTCTLDKKPAKPCTSPFKARVKPGKHAVVITATSPIGVVEAVPATVKFKVVKPH